MPELPEVEVIRRGLKNEILNKRISEVKVLSKNTVKPNSRTFAKELKGKSFLDIDRIGKLLIFELSDKIDFLLVHLKMTGQLIYTDQKEMIAGGHETKPRSSGRLEDVLIEEDLIERVGGRLPNKFTRVIITFNKRGSLYFNDMRKFGYMRIVDERELKKIKSAFGMEPRTKEFTKEGFIKAIKTRNKSIKAVLLDQSIIAGLGNIYTDESLFLSKVDPRRKASSLTDKEISALYKNIEHIIGKAIEYKGTTFSDYSDAKGNKGNFSELLQVYGRTGEKCKICGTKIEKIREAGRGTHFCPKCQF